MSQDNDGQGTGRLSALIAPVSDFPRPGILFRDITPLLADPAAFGRAVSALSGLCPPGAALVAGIESRGFIFGAAVAAGLGLGFVPIRKKGRLPRPAASITYQLEYGSDTLEIPSGAVEPGTAVVMVDDLLATGGTMAAASELVEKVGGRVVGAVFLVELSGLGGRSRLPGREVRSLVTY